ncbi:MAG: hypothetical protein JST43_08705 [Bacteroidetes bacterium]|nr:hypothetical protein [Bacteroidota bacterium]MBS1541406.1 hypothetical protein [Bacteroidota bacterium]
MRLTISFIFSVWCVGVVWAQDRKPIPLAEQSYKPTGIRVATDLISLGKTFAGPAFKGWEVNADMDLRNYYPTIDIGSWAKNVPITNGSYANSGNYFRVGVDINLLGKDPDKNMFFIGFRYGRSFFHENLTFIDSSPNLFLPVTVHQTNAHVTGSWAELTTGLRVKVWKELWTGYTARIKFAPSEKNNSSAFAPYDMPGYGIVGRTPWWGFDYQIFWRFAWKKEKPAARK